MKQNTVKRFPFGQNFYIFQYSAFFNSIASRCLHLALAWWILAITHDPSAFAVFVGIGTTADLLARGLLGSLGDRYNKQRLISICYWISFISATSIALLASLQWYIPFILFICEAFNGLALGMREPLQNSIIPFQVNKELLSSAIRWRSASVTIVTFCSPIIGTGLISIIGAQQTIWFCVGFIILSILILKFAKQTDTSLANTIQRPKWYSGFTTILRLPPEISLIKITFFMNLALYPFFGVVLPAFFYQHYRQSPWLFGVTDMIFALGMFIGATQIGPLANAFFGRVITTYSGYLALSIGILFAALMCQILTTFNLGYFMILCFGMLIAGCGLMIAVTNTSFMRSAASPQHFLNRISASSTFGTGIASPLGVVLSGVLIKYLGLNMTLIIFSLILLMASIASFLSINLRKILSLPDQDIHGAYQRFYPRAFSKDVNIT